MAGRNGVYGAGREALLDAVIELVGRDGLTSLSYRKVAQIAGVDNTLISHHFGSKTALLEAAMDHAARRTLEGTEFERIFHGAIADNVLDAVRESPERQAFQFEMVLASRTIPALRPAAERLYGAYVERMQAALAAAGYDADEAVARLVFAALDGLVFQRLTVATEDQTRSAMDQVERLLPVGRKASPAAERAT
ncbi:TetR family transcriptional regulator [Kocuria sp. LUK]|uniref:TetR/AcrR family transcriptional regulator n=1 Tax=Kocuria sp. LUK TaxID=2897828 RepID=UPI001E2EA462|nr:TetR family transcriptional regulator [Kocuria sp. LUK]MCD1145366.1 TetR family transcriptional regulator [Kocuria sp. LUK]